LFCIQHVCGWLLLLLNLPDFPPVFAVQTPRDQVS
jgi:hypothetical protein